MYVALCFESSRMQFYAHLYLMQQTHKEEYYIIGIIVTSYIIGIIVTFFIVSLQLFPQTQRFYTQLL